MGQTALKQKQRVSMQKIKNKNKSGEICQLCGQAHAPNGGVAGKRKNLGIKALRDEVESLVLINTRINTATAAAQIKNFPAAATKEQILLFIEAALNTLAEARQMQRTWWQGIKAKYPKLPIGQQNVFVDFDTYEFYISEQKGK